MEQDKLAQKAAESPLSYRNTARGLFEINEKTGETKLIPGTEPLRKDRVSAYDDFFGGGGGDPLLTDLPGQTTQEPQGGVADWQAIDQLTNAPQVPPSQAGQEAPRNMFYSGGIEGDPTRQPVLKWTPKGFVEE